MKKLSFFLFIVVTIISCSKNHANTPTNNTNDSISIPLGTISANLNGVPTVFNFNCGIDTLLDGIDQYWSFTVLINGATNPKANGGIEKSIQLYIQKCPAQLIGMLNIRPGSFPIVGTVGADTDINTEIDYDTASMHLYNYIPSTNQYVDTFETANFLYSDYSSAYTFPPISITSISDSTIKGTFSGGIMIKVGTGNPTDINVTYGEFYVPIKH